MGTIFACAWKFEFVEIVLVSISGFMRDARDSPRFRLRKRRSHDAYVTLFINDKLQLAITRYPTHHHFGGHSVLRAAL